MHPDYLEKVLNAQVYDVAIETPLDLAGNLSARIGNRILLKREDLQPVFSFKLRGAYNKIASLSAEKLKRGVICASAGNHAQGVALSARPSSGCRAVIVMPTSTPGIKIERGQAASAGEVVLFGDSYDEAYAHALELEKSEKLTFVHPFDDPEVIAGQGTIGMEILRQHSRHNGPIHAIFCCVGGGGLICRRGRLHQAPAPGNQDHRRRGQGCRCDDAVAGQRATACALTRSACFADGAAVKFVGEETFRLCKEYVDEMILVDTDAICAAIKDVFEDTRSILEPAGALAVAGAKEYARQHKLKDKNLVAIASGANMNFDRLRFVAERAEVGEQREAVLAVTLPEKPGAYKKFLALIGKRNVTEFNYRYHTANEAHVFVGIQVADRNESLKLVDSLQQARLPDARPDRRRNGQEPHPPHGRRPRPGGLRKGHARVALPLRVPRAAGRADELPDPDERRLEHQPVPLPQPWRRLRPRAGRHAGAAGRDGRVPDFPQEPRLRPLGRERQPGLQTVSRLAG